MHHADHGCQDTSLAFGRRLTEAGLIGSMGTVGDALDNAVAESFFATLEASCWTVIPGRHAPGCARRRSTSSRSSTTVNAATRPSTITAPYLRAAARISSPRRIATVSTKAVTGFTRQLATSVRVADPDRQAPMTDLFGGGPVYGGTYPALIFRDYIAAVLANHRVLDLPRSPGTIPSSGSTPGPRRGRWRPPGRPVGGTDVTGGSDDGGVPWPASSPPASTAVRTVEVGTLLLKRLGTMHR